MNSLTLEQQAARFGVTVEQIRQQYLRCAAQAVEMENAARKAHLQGKRLYRGSTAESYHQTALNMFAKATQ